MLGERGVSERLEGFLSPTGARDRSCKDAVICGVTSWSAEYVET
jgi:hypothetical protein